MATIGHGCVVEGHIGRDDGEHVLHEQQHHRRDEDEGEDEDVDEGVLAALRVFCDFFPI